MINGTLGYTIISQGRLDAFITWSRSSTLPRSLFPTFALNLEKKRLAQITHHKCYLLITWHQSEMKFIAFFAFVAAASASHIFPSTGPNCQQNVPTIQGCGFTRVNQDIASAKIVYEGQTIIFYQTPDCQGQEITVQSSTPCYPFQFPPRCVRILC